MAEYSKMSREELVEELEALQYKLAVAETGFQASELCFAADRIFQALAKFDSAPDSLSHKH